MLEKLDSLKARYEELNKLLSDPDVLKDHNLLKKYSKERAGLEEVVTTYDEYRGVLDDMAAAKEMIEEAKDKEVREFARAELEELEEREEKLEERLHVLLVPKDPNDEKNTIVEIRAGTGGEEAALFAGDLFRMYDRFAEHQGWKVDVMNSNPTGTGGFKEIIFMVIGGHVYSRMKYESGVHRVQRVPVTESQGRIHTSAATVAVLP
ncbi:MAG: PCRF domain-containing protein, partial [Candidatus Eisenbacteria bacterium]|nr:PCRF domain-containing protein [Candidatus Eisenbacteria bacterium]